MLPGRKFRARISAAGTTMLFIIMALSQMMHSSSMFRKRGDCVSVSVEGICSGALIRAKLSCITAQTRAHTHTHTQEPSSTRPHSRVQVNFAPDQNRQLKFNGLDRHTTSLLELLPINMDKLIFLSIRLYGSLALTHTHPSELSIVIGVGKATHGSSKTAKHNLMEIKCTITPTTP